MNNLLFLILNLTISFSLIGCNNDRYQIEKDKSGRTYRLDKKTGEIVLVQDGQLKLISEQTAATKSTTADMKVYNPISMAHVHADSATFRAQMRNNIVYMIIEIWPIPRNYGDFQSRKAASVEEVFHQKYPIWLYLYNKNGFEIKSQSIARADIKTIIDHLGKNSHLRIDHQSLMSATEFEEVASWSLGFNFE